MVNSTGKLAAIIFITDILLNTGYAERIRSNLGGCFRTKTYKHLIKETKKYNTLRTQG